MIYTTADKEKHLYQILELQRLNLAIDRSEEDIQREGFVTCEHSIDLLSEMNKPHPHIIALEEEKVIGYALVMLQEMRDSLNVLRPMFDNIDKLYPKSNDTSEDSYFVMGQICIDSDHRGQGVFYSLYNHMKLGMSPYYDLCITEISSLNKRSLKAHANQGFKTVHKYTSSDGHPWEIVAWDWS
ncbi:MAG: hypothetical protein ACI9FN_004068 [Saprospiraceae bacterium]|jgi:hypothetical protein